MIKMILILALITPSVVVAQEPPSSIVNAFIGAYMEHTNILRPPANYSVERVDVWQEYDIYILKTYLESPRFKCVYAVYENKYHAYCGQDEFSFYDKHNIIIKLISEYICEGYIVEIEKKYDPDYNFLTCGGLEYRLEINNRVGRVIRILPSIPR
jgi:hypothetical protein